MGVQLKGPTEDAHEELHQLPQSFLREVRNTGSGVGTEYLSRVLAGLWKTMYSRLVSRHSTMDILPTIPSLCPIRQGQGTVTHNRHRVCKPLGLTSRERGSASLQGQAPLPASGSNSSTWTLSLLADLRQGPNAK